jgi:glutamate N-acetyltransferase/amino-acid N-acetyltransferase
MLPTAFAQAIVCNSGNANTCNVNGVEIAFEMCQLVGKTLGISPSDEVVASTGVNWQTRSLIDPIADGIPVARGACSRMDSNGARKPL